MFIRYWDLSGFAPRFCLCPYAQNMNSIMKIAENLPECCCRLQRVCDESVFGRSRPAKAGKSQRRTPST